MIYLMRAGQATESEVERIRVLPDFRKATRNMALAYVSLEKIAAELSPEILGEIGLVFGSSHGELETTKEFLKTLAEQEIARPILFQNSLHHSTVGFLAMRLGLSAPTVTISNGIYTAENAFEAARMLLLEGMVENCLVTVVDEIVPELRGVMEITSARLGEGATTLLLTTNPKRFSFSWIAAFADSFRIETNTENKPCFSPGIGNGVGTPTLDHDTNALECLVRSVLTPNQTGVSFLKRDGGFSEITWERPK